MSAPLKASSKDRMAGEDKKRKLAAECFRKGTEAMAKQNWDYAVDMLDKSTALDPPNLMYRQTKRGCTKKKYKDNGSGAKMAGVKLMGIRGRIKKCRMKKDWAGVDRATEEGLIVNPWDTGLLVDLGDACKEQEYDEIAVECYLQAVKAEPKNIDYLKRIGNLLRDRGEYIEARKYWERIMQLKPNDEEARVMVSKLMTEQTMDRGGYEGAENTREVKTESSKQTAYERDREARSGSGKPDGPGQDAEADLQRAIRKEPADVGNYLQLASLYTKQKKLDFAIATLRKGLDASGNDVNIREKLEDLELDMMRQNVSLAKADAKANTKDKAVVKKYQQLRVELLKREIAALSARVERNPKDPKIKLQLGLTYKTVKDWKKAIPLLQQASTSASLKAEASIALGECFVNDGKIGLGRRQFEKAIGAISGQDEPELFCQVHYALGRIYERQENIDKAEEHYTEVLGENYDYKDTQDRLENLGD